MVISQLRKCAYNEQQNQGSGTLAGQLAPVSPKLEHQGVKLIFSLTLAAP